VSNEFKVKNGLITPSIKSSSDVHDLIGNGAVKIPLGTVEQRPTGQAGLLRFNTAANQFEGHDGTEWGAIAGGGGISLTDLSVTVATASGNGTLSYNNTTGVFTFTPADLSTKQNTLVSGTNIKTINNESILGSGDITIAGGAADLSEVAEDILPSSDGVFDIGSEDKRWLDVFVENSVDIAGAKITGNEDGVVVDAVLAGELLIAENMITPDDLSARQYFGDKGVVDINGNMDILGDWIGVPVVETTEEILGGLAGELDDGFDIGNGFNAQVISIALQSDGKILVGGEFTSYDGTTQNFITRLNSDGSRDTTFDIGTGFNNGVTSIALQSDGKILVGGASTSYNGVTQNNLTRLNPDGSRDTTFDIGTGFTGEFFSFIYSIAIQSDGKILVGGSFTSYNGTTQNNLTRLNPDGSRDTTFDIGTGFNITVYSIAIQSDGKIIVGGEFTSYDGTTQNNLTRLNPDGSRDTTFDIGTGFTGEFFSLILKVKIQSDGKILVGGGFTEYNGVAQNNFTRLNADGSRDTTFVIGTGFNITVYSIAIQSDGKIIVGGEFTSYDGVTQNRIARLNSDGSLDTTFDIGTGLGDDPGFFNIGLAQSIAIQSDGKIVVGGIFISYNDVAQLNITRIFGEAIEGTPAILPPLLGEEGFIRYNKATLKFEGYTGDQWNNVTLETDLDSKQDQLVSGTNIKTINNESILGSGNITIEGGGIALDDLSVTVGTASGNGTLSYNNTSGVFTFTPADLSTKQDTLVSGTDIKTINNESILGAGNITVQTELFSGTNIKTINNESILGAGNITVQTELVSGTNIKTVNGTTLLGSGDLEIGGSVEISETAPSDPDAGDLWWDSTSGTLKIYYDDGASQQWVDASPTLQSDFGPKNVNIIDTPAGEQPEPDEVITLDETFELVASAYSDNLGRDHTSSDWQISDDPAFGTTEVESLNDTSNLTSYEVDGGISTEDTFYWRVRYRDSEGNVSAWSTPIEYEVAPPPDTLGQSYGGGIYMGTVAAAGTCYYLIVAPNATGCAQCQWKTTATATAGTDSDTDGYANTYGPMDNSDHPAGNWCATRTINGFSDWYLPAIEELETFYDNGATGADESVIGSGEAFAHSFYWSSTESNASYVCTLSFTNGGRAGRGKTCCCRVRAVRREPI
jgi:uncharacterized delta-60 repeat protein